MTIEKSLKREIVGAGKKLYCSQLVASSSGNISARLDMDSLLITASGTCLGELVQDDIVRVDIYKKSLVNAKKPSSELPLHSLIYKNLAAKRVIHCHPPLTNAYFALFDSLEKLILETDFYLGELAVLPQKTVTVTDPEPVVRELKKNSIVVLKNHGVIAIGDDFKGPIAKIEALESAVKIAAVARLFKKKGPDSLDKALKKSICRT